MIDILKDQLLKEAKASLEKEIEEKRKARNKRKAHRKKIRISK